MSISVSLWLVCAIAFSNSKSAGFLNPLRIKSALTFLQKSTVRPSYSIFSRLFYSTLGTKSSLGPEILDSWEILGIEGKYVKPLIFASYSTYQLFINSDKHVFAESVESWINVISHYCGQWGWGDAIDLTVEQDSSSIKINCKQNEMLPFFIGHVMGIWERSNGRKPRVSLLFTEDDVKISIESLLEYIWKTLLS